MSSTYDCVPRTDAPVRVFVKHPAGDAQVATLRIATDQRALGEGVAREIALGGGCMELQSHAGPEGLGLGHGLEGEREGVAIDVGAMAIMHIAARSAKRGELRRR